MAPDAAAHPNHHLWNNHGTWWVHATVLRGGVRQERVRRSLETHDLAEARRRRDRFLGDLQRQPDIQLSIRFGQPRGKSPGPDPEQKGGAT